MRPVSYTHLHSLGHFGQGLQRLLHTGLTVAAHHAFYMQSLFHGHILQKPSVRKELQEIKQEQAEKKAEKAKQQEHQSPAAGRSRKKKRKRAKGR